MLVKTNAFNFSLKDTIYGLLETKASNETDNMPAVGELTDAQYVEKFKDTITRMRLDVPLPTGAGLDFFLRQYRCWTMFSKQNIALAERLLDGFYGEPLDPFVILDELPLSLYPGAENHIEVGRYVLGGMASMVFGKDFDPKSLLARFYLSDFRKDLDRQWAVRYNKIFWKTFLSEIKQRRQQLLELYGKDVVFTDRLYSDSFFLLEPTKHELFLFQSEEINFNGFLRGRPERKLSNKKPSPSVIFAEHHERATGQRCLTLRFDRMVRYVELCEFLCSYPDGRTLAARLSSKYFHLIGSEFENEVLEKPIEQLNVSTATLNILKMWKFKNVRDVLRIRPGCGTKVPDLGKNRKRQVEEALLEISGNLEIQAYLIENF